MANFRTSVATYYKTWKFERSSGRHEKLAVWIFSCLAVFIIVVFSFNPSFWYAVCWKQKEKTTYSAKQWKRDYIIHWTLYRKRFVNYRKPTFRIKSYFISLFLSEVNYSVFKQLTKCRVQEYFLRAFILTLCLKRTPQKILSLKISQ